MRIVSIGGGTGQSLLLTALKNRDHDLTAIATTLDSGRSSGVLRDELGMIAPGDLRNCLLALSDSDEWFKSVLQYRFEGYIPGMNIGNLIFAAIHEMDLDFDEALEEVSALLKLRGRAYPATLDPVHLKAHLTDGTVLEREDRIVREEHAPIASVELTEPAGAFQKAVQAIEQADLIIVGPGALYTSIAPHFLIDGIREAFQRTRAYTVFVPNLAQQRYVTEGYSATDHLEVIEGIAGRSFDAIVINTAEAPEPLAARYEEAGSPPIETPASERAKLRERLRVIEADLLSKTVEEEWNKLLYMRHDPEKLANAILGAVHKPLRGLILAAGKGTRMRPFSNATPKVLLPLYGKPLIAYRIEELLASGIREIVIVCSEETCDAIRELSRTYPDARFSFAIQREAKGPAHAIECAGELIRGSRIVLLLGDNLADRPIVPDLIESFGKPGAAGAVAAKRVPNPSEFGVADLKDGRVVRILEKPDDPPSDLAVMGVVALDADRLLAHIAERGYTIRTKEGEREISAPQYFTDGGDALELFECDARILDVGRPYDLVSAVEMLGEHGGQVHGYVHPDADVDDASYVGPDAVIEAGAVVRKSQIDGYVGRGAKVSSCVTMEGSRIGSDCVLERSVIGRRATVLSGLKVKAEDADVIIKGKRMRPGKVGMFAGEGIIVEKSEPGRIL